MCEKCIWGSIAIDITIKVRFIPNKCSDFYKIFSGGLDINHSITNGTEKKEMWSYTHPVHKAAMQCTVEKKGKKKYLFIFIRMYIKFVFIKLVIMS